MIAHNPHKIHLIQHNCMKSREVTIACLESALETADIVLIPEPRILQDPNNPRKKIYSTHNAFEMIRPTEEKPRVMIYVTKSNIYLKYRQDQFDNPDVMGLTVWTEDEGRTHIKATHIFNIYNERRPIDARTAYTRERQMLDFNFQPKSILASDMNAHHPWWNTQTKTGKNHHHLLEIVEKGNFDLINISGETTYNYRSGTGSSVIDLTFATRDVAAAVGNWAVDEGPGTGSDHEMIRFEIISDNLEFIPTATTQKDNWQKAEWEEFQKYLKEKAQQHSEEWEEMIRHTSEQNMERAAIEMTALLKEAADKFVPKLNPSSRSKLWWNEEIETKRMHLHLALKNWNIG